MNERVSCLRSISLYYQKAKSENANDIQKALKSAEALLVFHLDVTLEHSECRVCEQWRGAPGRNQPSACGLALGVSRGTGCTHALRRLRSRGGQTKPHSGNRTGTQPCQKHSSFHTKMRLSHKGNPTERNPKMWDNFRTRGQMQSVPRPPSPHGNGTKYTDR